MAAKSLMSNSEQRMTPAYANIHTEATDET